MNFRGQRVATPGRGTNRAAGAAAPPKYLVFLPAKKKTILRAIVRRDVGGRRPRKTSSFSLGRRKRSCARVAARNDLLPSPWGEGPRYWLPGSGVGWGTADRGRWPISANLSLRTCPKPPQRRRNVAHGASRGNKDVGSS